MKSLITTIALIIASSNAYADDPIIVLMDDPTSRPVVESLEETDNTNVEYNSDPDYIYEDLGSEGSEPMFPGGQVALFKYIADHLQYPQTAFDNGIQGKVTVQFVVTKTGSIGRVKVVRGVDPDLDKAAVRIIKALPKFTPGMIEGQPVNYWYTLPITFKLQNR